MQSWRMRAGRSVTFLGWSELEWLANGFYATSVILAARNSIHTLWTGIVVGTYSSIYIAAPILLWMTDRAEAAAARAKAKAAA